MTERDTNPFPSIELFPRLTAVAHAIGSFILERHEVPKRGAAEMLDQELYGTE